MDVLVNLTWTYGIQVDGRTRYYGPGLVPVPREVAERRGWEIVAEVQPAEIAESPTPVNATDSARELAEEHGIDLSTVTGTGADGRIILSDIKALI